MTHSNNDTDKNNGDDSNDIQDRSTVNQQFGHGNGYVDRGYSPVPTHYIYIKKIYIYILYVNNLILVPDVVEW